MGPPIWRRALLVVYSSSLSGCTASCHAVPMLLFGSVGAYLVACVCCCRGLAHEKLGNHGQAIQALRQAAQLDPGNDGVITALNRCGGNVRPFSCVLLAFG
jgi:hypothetical protein